MHNGIARQRVYFVCDSFFLRKWLPKGRKFNQESENFPRMPPEFPEFPFRTFYADVSQKYFRGSLQESLRGFSEEVSQNLKKFSRGFLQEHLREFRRQFLQESCRGLLQDFFRGFFGNNSQIPLAIISGISSGMPQQIPSGFVFRYLFICDFL